LYRLSLIIVLLRLLNDGGVNDGVNGGVNFEELLFDAIKNNPGVNAPALAEMLQKSLRTVQRYLKQLSDTGRIAFRGAPKSGGYYI
jgi:predicted HTH transcriptional regulator